MLSCSPLVIGESNWLVRLGSEAGTSIAASFSMTSTSDRKPVRTMKAAAIDRFGPPSVLKLHELPVPEPGPNEVLIALHGAGIGVWDADIRKGWWPSGRPKFPLVLGTDGAGVVAA